MRKIRVLVVEDSMLFRELLINNLNKDPGIEVVASARDPFEARDKIIEHRPDVMTLDIEMPKMNGIEFLRKLMPQYPLPVIMISSLSEKVFDAMNAGAVDFVAKPANATREQIEMFIRTELPVKIKIASIAKIGTNRSSTINLQNPPPLTPHIRSKTDDVIVAIGASTGGTEAIASLIQEFDADMPPIVIVQHMPAGFTEMYAKRLDDKCRLHVKEAKDGDLALPGQALLAPGGTSQMKLMKIGGRYQVSIRPAPKVNGHCPSVEVLFDSVAKAAKDRAVGIILTGMGGDGAKGLLAMREAGARTIGQDESTCVVYGMPRVAYELGAVEYQEKLGDIAGRTCQLLNSL
jgi:two-component system chemotaxis response regulator CheB